MPAGRSILFKTGSPTGAVSFGRALNRWRLRPHPERDRCRHQGGPDSHRRHVNPRPPGRPGTDGADRAARQARRDRQRSSHGNATGPSDNGDGTEFTSNAILEWAGKMQVKWHYIAPGKPMRDTGTARRSTAACATRCRSSASIMPGRLWPAGPASATPSGPVPRGYQAPAVFAAQLAAPGDQLRASETLRRSPTAPPAQPRQVQPRTLVSAG